MLPQKGYNWYVKSQLSMPKNITVNCVSPGFDMTSRKIKSYSKIPMGKMGSGDDVSNCVAFLSSEEASYNHRRNYSC